MYVYVYVCVCMCMCMYMCMCMCMCICMYIYIYVCVCMWRVYISLGYFSLCQWGVGQCSSRTFGMGRCRYPRYRCQCLYRKLCCAFTIDLHLFRSDLSGTSCCESSKTHKETLFIHELFHLLYDTAQGRRRRRRKKRWSVTIIFTICFLEIRLVFAN